MYYAVIAENIEELRSLSYLDMIQDSIDKQKRLEVLATTKRLVELEIEFLNNEWDGRYHE